MDSIVAPERQEEFLLALGTAGAGLKSKRFDTVLLSSTGGEVFLEGAFYPRLPDSNCIQGVFSDMTEYRALESQFRQTQKMEALGRLAGGVAHDFNNMLGAIEGYATLGMAKLARTDQLWCDLDEIRRVVSRAAGLTRQLLFFSRKQKLQRGPVSLKELFSGLSRMLSSTLGERYTLNAELADVMAQLNGDQAQLEQVLMNLVLNARDAMPDGGTILLKAEVLPAEGLMLPSGDSPVPAVEFIRICVADSGAGIPPEIIEHLFEPFFTTKEKGKGTGLGLSIAYGIVKRHGGWIDVESAPGKGAKFFVFLPASFDVPTAAPESLKPPALGSGVPVAGMKVLVLEDDGQLLGMVVKALSVYGLLPLKAACLAEGMSLLRQHGGAIKAVFSDIRMPDGMATDHVGEMLLLAPAAKVIFTSGYPLSDELENSISRRGYQFLLKPYGVEDIIRLLAA